MKPKRDITPYMGSADINMNASISLLKIYKRLRTIDPSYTPPSRCKARLQNKQATRRTALHIVR
jgi:hypothetical protein